jgi:DNA invertase Pin-like site-specific DNA recombinase
MATALYARASDHASLDAQVSRLAEHAQAQGWSRPEEFTDCASGTDNSRPGWKALQQAVADGRVDTVLVLSPDRFARDAEELGSLLAAWL